MDLFGLGTLEMAPKMVKIYTKNTLNAMVLKGIKWS